uniref:TIR domain-containing protein n=1 Tax=Poecilia reticulata TaxID=8081 RepID=A0A3P9MYS8_POERE
MFTLNPVPGGSLLVLLKCPVTSSLYFCDLRLFFSCAMPLSDHQGEADTYHVSAGHLFLLSCPIAGEIKWSRGDAGDESLPSGVEVRGGSLWFLPVQMTHSGSYICERRSDNIPHIYVFTFILYFVVIPPPPKKKRNKECILFVCTQDCQQVQPDGESVSLNTNGLMRLVEVSEADAGKYTCHIDVTVDGRNYTAARSVQMTVKNGTVHLNFGQLNVGQSAMLSLDGVACFALRLLPEELEQKHGYSLFIRGRDDRPGEGQEPQKYHIMGKESFLVITSSSNCNHKTTTAVAHVLHKNAVHDAISAALTYEQKVGLHDALMRNDPKVILVEVDGPVDYSQLPESLRYIKRTQGALEWKNSFAETNKLTQMYLKRNFWKSLRCHMPAVPARRLQSIKNQITLIRTL